MMIAQFAGSVVLFLFLVFWPGRTLACAKSLALWSSGLLLSGFGTFFLGQRGEIPDLLSIVAANFLVTLGIGLCCGGFAMFLGQRSRIWFFAMLAFVWLVLCAYPGFYESFIARMNYAQGALILSFSWVAWLAFKRNRENLYSAKLLGVTALIEVAAFVWCTVHQNLLNLPSFEASFPKSFMTVYLVTVLFCICMFALLPAAMVIERTLQGFRAKAFQDELTHLANRRAFLRDSEEWLWDSQEEKGKFYSVVLFSLDKLEDVNKKFSHAMGDALLQLFGRLLKDGVPGKAIPGRIGNAEFAVFLPEADQELAHLTAQRICRRFGVECKQASQGKLAGTASVGLVTTSSETLLDRAMEAAERGLQKAQKKGAAQIVAVNLSSNGREIRDAKLIGFSSLRKKAA